VAQQPSFDWRRLSSADKILLVGSGLMFIVSLLPWQRVCVSFLKISACGSANEWGGTAAFIGTLAALCVIALLAFEVMRVLGVKIGPSAPTIGSALVLATLALTVLKFLLVVGKHGSYGAWLGLILALVVAYGGYMKMDEARANPPASGIEAG
jgi:hypothetical protein